MGGIIINPDFPASVREAKALARSLRANPKPLARPVLVLDGWHGPLLPSQRSAWNLSRHTSGRRRDFLAVGYPWAFSVEHAARCAMYWLERRGWLDREIDIVGISMGGIVARAITSGVLGVGGPDRVRAVRVFTFATPHTGAILADRVAVDRAARQLRRGSDLLKRLDDALSSKSYDLYCYALLRDWLVGATRTFPSGTQPYWVDPEGLQRPIAHFVSPYEHRLGLDVALRLRGEAPIAVRASTPPSD